MAKIALFCVNDFALKTELDKLCKKMNKKQKHRSFEFFVSNVPLVFPDGTKMEDKHNYSHAQHFSLLKQKQGKYKIGITQNAITENCFNAQDISNTNNLVGIVTTDDMEKFNVKGRSKRQYLAYLVLCVTICLLAGEDLEEGHEIKPDGLCLFDPCRGRDKLTRCLKEPHICRECLAHLDNNGLLSNEQIEDAKSILKFVKHKSFKEAFMSTVSMRYMGLLFGFLINNGILLTANQMGVNIVLNGLEWWIMGVGTGLFALLTIINWFSPPK
jgi:hypothetical protein